MSKRIYIGVLTPSSNTALEPITSAIVADMDDFEVSAHFARFPVTQISLSGKSNDQFQLETIESAVRMLADAKVDLICWSGTAASWLGVQQDLDLCDMIQSVAGVPATTSVLALDRAFENANCKRVGLVSPYLTEVQNRIIENYRARGIDMSNERHLGLQVNHEFGVVTHETLEKMIMELKGQALDAITVMCTNLRAADMVARVEQEVGVPILDSGAAVIWDAARMLGIDTSGMSAWGSLFVDPRFRGG